MQSAGTFMLVCRCTHEKPHPGNPVRLFGKKESRLLGAGSFCLWCHSAALFLDTGALSGTLAEVVQFGTTHPTYFVQFDRLDIGAVEREKTFYTYAVRHFANGEGLGHAATLTLDNVAAVGLDTLFGTFNNAVVNGNVITRFELGNRFLSGHLFVNESYGVHGNFQFERAKVWEFQH